MQDWDYLKRRGAADQDDPWNWTPHPVSYTHLRAHET